MADRQRNRVAIISKQENIVNFLKMEADWCGCSVTVSEAPPMDVRGYDRIVMDAKLGYCMPGDSSCQVVTLFTDGMEREEVDIGTCWEWPVSLSEVRSFFEGSSHAPQAEERTECGEPTLYILSEKNRTVLYRNRQIELTDRGWQLLLLLAQAGGETVDREELFELFETQKGNIVDVYVHHLRKSLEEPFGIRLIRTVRGKGYSLNARLVWLTKKTTTADGQ